MKRGRDERKRGREGRNEGRSEVGRERGRDAVAGGSGRGQELRQGRRCEGNGIKIVTERGSAGGVGGREGERRRQG